MAEALGHSSVHSWRPEYQSLGQKAPWHTWLRTRAGGSSYAPAPPLPSAAMLLCCYAAGAEGRRDGADGQESRSGRAGRVGSRAAHLRGSRLAHTEVLVLQLGTEASLRQPADRERCVGRVGRHCRIIDGKHIAIRAMLWDVGYGKRLPAASSMVRERSSPTNSTDWRDALSNPPSICPTLQQRRQRGQRGQPSVAATGGSLFGACRGELCRVRHRWMVPAIVIEQPAGNFTERSGVCGHN